MFDLLQPFLGNLVLSGIIFLLLFVLLAVLMARDRAGALVLGLLRIIAAFFVSPFVYLRKTILRIASFDGDAESRGRRSEQYLLHRLLLALSAIAVLVSIGVLTAAGVSGWNHAREVLRLNKEASEVRARLVQAKAERERLATYVNMLDEQWQNGRPALIAAFVKHQQRTVDSLDRVSGQLESSTARALSGEPDAASAFQNIVRYANSNRENPGWYFATIRGNIRSFIDRQSISDDAKDRMRSYTEAWYQARTAMSDPNVMGPDQLRRVLQPTRADSLERRETLDTEIPMGEVRRAALEAGARSESAKTLTEPLKGVMRFLLFVWGVGLAIEALALGVHTATHIQRMSERGEGAEPADA